MVLAQTRPGEWSALSTEAKRLLTPAVLERWTDALQDDDVTLAEIAGFERKRLDALRTLRAGAELTDLEWKLLRLLQKHEGQNVSYLTLARGLWSTPTSPVTARTLVVLSGDAYQAPMIKHIQVLVCGIRKKLEIDPLRPQHLATIRGVGYRWYSHPPALDDGENYAARTTAIERDRAEMQRVLGLTEGEFTVVEARDQDGQVFETSVWFGPEHPDHPGSLSLGDPDDPPTT